LTEHSTRRKSLEFGLTVGIAFIVLTAMLFRLRNEAYPYTLCIGIALILAGLAKPRLLGPVQRLWTGASTAVGWVMTRVILCAVFFAIITPIGLALRLFGKELLDVKTDGSAATYWRGREDAAFDRSRCESQY